MRLAAFLLALLVFGAAVEAREIVDASTPQDLSVTVYRDPNRGEGQEMDRDWPRGFAMISEMRTVTLPPGESTIRFEGVAEGMVAVSAIVTGLPGGTIEKNRNAELLSPAALVNGALGNRVTITRTNPASGQARSEQAIVRTRADGGLVLQTQDGFEAVRCSGLPEKLAYERIPRGLSAKPVFSIDTSDEAGGTHTVTLTYLAWGFDWQANYVGTLQRGDGTGKFAMQLMSWLTILNDNSQSFPDADLLAVAGTINVESDFEDLSDPPVARPLRLTCYPLGSTAAGSPLNHPPPPPPLFLAPPVAAEAMADGVIMVTGSRVRQEQVLERMMAGEEDLGDLKLYRVPEPVTVAARGLKQVAFLNKDEVEAEFLYRAECDPYDYFDADDDSGGLEPMQMLLVIRNEEKKGLGAALPMGGLAVFEPGSFGPQLVGEPSLRDYAVGQDIELEMGTSAQVFAQCAIAGESNPDENRREWTRMRARLSNANSNPVRVRMVLGWPGEWEVRWPRLKPLVKDGRRVVEFVVAANSTRSFDWKIRKPKEALGD